MTKEERKIYNKEYREKHKEGLREKRKFYPSKSKEKRRIQNKIYYKAHKKEIIAYVNEYNKKRAKIDPLFKLSNNLRVMASNALTRKGFKKTAKTASILGCSFEELKTYLESKFELWMTWENYGKYNQELNFGWDIDHVVPLSSAKNKEEILKLNHYTNLQPLCSYINRNVKGK